MKRKRWRRNLNSRNREGKGVKGWGGLLNYMYIHYPWYIYMCVCASSYFYIRQSQFRSFSKKSLLKVFG